tara:strand:- start:50 stop:886 length:837 start_codon:yes stop_codon:yes gene_type:complete
MNNINCYTGTKKLNNSIIEKFANSCNGKIFNDNKYRKGLSVCFGLDSKILDKCIKDNLPYIYLDKSILFDVKERTNRIRVGINKIYNTNIIERQSDRFESLPIKLMPWKNTGNHILICPPTEGGFTKQRIWRFSPYNILNIQPAWLELTIRKIREASNRKIIIRPKKWNKRYDKIVAAIKNVEASVGRSLAKDFEDCWATVAPSSGVSILGLIEGIPSFCEPDKLASHCSLSDYSKIESPLYCDRTNLFNHLSYLDFSIEEIESGIAWDIIEKTINEI